MKILSREGTILRGGRIKVLKLLQTKL